jgi:outer membrane murein-binding lipoprotein Lpp
LARTFTRLLFPVSPKASSFGTVGDWQSSPGKLASAAALHKIGVKARCYDSSMLEEFDQLAAKVSELAHLVQSLRAENQQLRAQLATATGELEAMRMRVDEASRRLDGLMERLPTPSTSTNAPWNT